MAGTTALFETFFIPRDYDVMGLLVGSLNITKITIQVRYCSNLLLFSWLFLRLSSGSSELIEAIYLATEA